MIRRLISASIGEIRRIKAREVKLAIQDISVLDEIIFSKIGKGGFI